MMSTTESRSGFRLPWASDAPRTGSDASSDPETEPDGPQVEAAVEADQNAADEVPAASAADESPEATEQPSAEHTAAENRHGILATPDGAVGLHAAPAPEPATQPAAKARRDNPLLAGLVRAMREAAESARAEAAARVAAASTARVESIHAASAEEATAIRKDADEEIGGIRDWSKAEIARIREETERRVTDRRRTLEEELEAHAASVERRIDAVRTAVAEFEATMTAFFERLLAEDDPSRLATLAEQMPDPPDLEAVTEIARTRKAKVGVTVAAPAAASPDAEAVSSDVEVPPTSQVEALDAEGAAAAEAEALAAVDAVLPDDPNDSNGIELVADDDVARRLEILTTPQHTDGDPAAAPTVTRVAVVGLVSVASISVFKRALARVPDVRTVSVTSGPDGDFVFSVTHGPEVDLQAAIPSLPGFEARITDHAEGVLSVVAHDPEA